MSFRQIYTVNSLIFLVHHFPFPLKTLMFPLLKKFKSSFKRPALYSDPPRTLPSFLQQNLQDEARVIKFFENDQHAFIRIFCFQLLKLCFEGDQTDSSSKLDKLIQLIENHDSLLRLPIRSLEENISALQTKELLMQFFELLGSSNKPVYHILSQYPIIEELLTNFLSSYLEKIVQKNSDNSSIVFEILCQNFSIDVVEYDNCFQFVDTQVYAYLFSSQQVYLVFIDQEKALRNTKIYSQSAGNELVKQKYPEEDDNRLFKTTGEVIMFDAPELVFETGAEFQSHEKKFILTATKETFTLEQPQTQNQVEDVLQEILSRQNMKPMFSQVKKQEQSGKKFGLNITKQFTNSLLLEELPQPYQNKIKAIKAKARAQRKARQMFFI